MPNDEETFSPHKTFIGCVLPNELLRCGKLSLTDKVVWARLAQYAGNREFCYPKQETLADELCITTRSVIRSLKTLEEQKFLKVERPNGAAKMNRLGNKYYFLKHKALNNGSHDNLSDAHDNLSHKGNDDSTLRAKRRREKPLCDNLSLQEENQKTKENQQTKVHAKTVELLKLFPDSFKENRSFQKAFHSYVCYKREDTKRPVTSSMAKAMLTQIKNDNLTVEEVTSQLSNAVASGWQGANLDKIRKFANNSARGRTIKPGQGTKDYGYDTLKKNDRVIDNSEFM